MLFDEICGRGNEYGDFYNPLYAVQITKGCLCLRQYVDGTCARCSLTMCDCKCIANLACVYELAIFQRKLARCEQQRARLCERYVVCSWCCGFWQRYTQIFKTAVDCVGHSINPY
ncbi:hypothetical protein D9M72_627560 [compost metagenome]